MSESTAERKRIAILFSGGYDSSAVAAYYLKRGRVAHLITFDNGAQKWLELSEYKAESIEKRFPGRCSWRLLDCTFLFHEIAIKTLESDVREFGNLVCCGCKLAMLAEAIIYCRKNGIAELADGFRKEQDYYPEQTPDYMTRADRFAAAYGIDYLHPLWDHPGLTPQQMALDAAIPTSAMQAYCLFGQNPVREKRFIGPYVESKLPALKAYVERALLPGGGGGNSR